MWEWDIEEFYGWVSGRGQRTDDGFACLLPVAYIIQASGILRANRSTWQCKKRGEDVNQASWWTHQTQHNPWVLGLLSSRPTHAHTAGTQLPVNKDDTKRTTNANVCSIFYTIKPRKQHMEIYFRISPAKPNYFASKECSMENKLSK